MNTLTIHPTEPNLAADEFKPQRIESCSECAELADIACGMDYETWRELYGIENAPDFYESTQPWSY
ncbi:hypothetical protein GC175_27570 [bacterium]|nr:hypothetical protein [bacterium]